GGPGRRASERGGRSVVPPGRRRATGGRGRRWTIVVVVALAAGGVALWLARGRAPLERSAAPAGAARDPAAGLDARAAFVRALDLGTKGRDSQSIPFLRRSVDGGPVRPLLLHRDLAAAL